MITGKTDVKIAVGSEACYAFRVDTIADCGRAPIRPDPTAQTFIDEFSSLDGWTTVNGGSISDNGDGTVRVTGAAVSGSGVKKSLGFSISPRGYGTADDVVVLFELSATAQAVDTDSGGWGIFSVDIQTGFADESGGMYELDGGIKSIRHSPDHSFPSSSSMIWSASQADASAGSTVRYSFVFVPGGSSGSSYSVGLIPGDGELTTVVLFAGPSGVDYDRIQVDAQGVLNG